ncbi:Trehalose-6-phosphate synthase [Candidatus Methanoperedenaceae archaeon GB50]|nr:Trehalose-6-phosphate synthase [Candidatus Methanoperedenaceae archaeon GB50]
MLRSLIGCEHSFGHITAENRVIRVDAFPMGIDYQRFARAAKEPKVKQEIQRIRHIVKTRNMVLSVDRLDYTKGIPQRLEAFDLFLEKNPKYKEKITLVLVAVPSRTNVEQYKLLKAELDELVGKINGKAWDYRLDTCLVSLSLFILYQFSCLV